MLNAALIVLSCSLLSCNGGEGNSECPLGEPVAIFRPDQPFVANHTFQQKGQEGAEVIRFVNGSYLEVFQSGCSSVRQEFRFREANPPADSGAYWLNRAVGQFRYLGTLAPEYQPFREWANALEATDSLFRMGQPLELDAGFYARLDRISGPDSSLLVIVLSQTPE